MVGGGIFNKKEPEGNMLIKVGGMMKVSGVVIFYFLFYITIPS